MSCVTFPRINEENQRFCRRRLRQHFPSSVTTASFLELSCFSNLSFHGELEESRRRSSVDAVRSWSSVGQDKVDILTRWTSVNSGMGRRRNGYFDKLKQLSLSRIFSVALLVLFLGPAVECKCRVDECTRKYSHQMREPLTPGPNAQYCSILRNYATCIRATARSCRGDLTYHTTSSLVIKWNSENNCSYILTSTKLKPHTNTRHNHNKFDSFGQGYRQECAYRGKPKFRHCALFGDPHLRTFHDQFQTCTVKGAWPLIDNSYLAVQVTNGPVEVGYRATAPTKITVIVKGHGSCMEEKTYEAQMGNLPAAFIDGTKMSSRSQSVVIQERVPGRHIEILIRYIATTIVIRQIGTYLTFAVRIPEEVGLRGAHHRLGLELCVKGCPVKERIDYNSFLSDPNRWIKAVAGENVNPALSKSAAVQKCQERNVTDYYFDSCVFDLLTTGDISFLETAEMAQKDVMTLHPNAGATLKNRTHLRSDNTYRNVGRNSDNNAPGRPSWHLLLFYLVTLILFLFY